MDTNAQIHYSKFLSLVLRHRPELVGLTPDPGGWVGIDELLRALDEHDRPISREELHNIVADNAKQRFAFSEDGRRIRASQGHSFEVDLGLEASAPPELLFHGTVAASLQAIMMQGLQKQQRHHVHLSADIDTATQVGGRRGKPVILEIAALRMLQSGQVFYRSANGVWLTETVAPEFLRVLEH